MAILYVGIDLAKNVFALHGVDEHAKAVLVRPKRAACPAASYCGGVAAVHHRHRRLLWPLAGKRWLTDTLRPRR